MDFSPLWISFKTTLAATVITFFLGVLAARWRYGYRGRLGGVIDAIFLLPLALPPTVIGLALLLFFGRHSPVGQMLSAVGVTVIFSWEATVITAVIVSFPLMYQTAHASFRQIDPDLLDIGRLYGMNEWQLLWKVMIVLSAPGLVAGVILSFTRALGEFGATLMLAGSIPGRTQTIPLAIYSFVDAGEMREAAILSLITLMISIVALLLIRFPRLAARP